MCCLLYMERWNHWKTVILIYRVSKWWCSSIRSDSPGNKPFFPGRIPKTYTTGRCARASTVSTRHTRAGSAVWHVARPALHSSGLPFEWGVSSCSQCPDCHCPPWVPLVSPQNRRGFRPWPYRWVPRASCSSLLRTCPND